MPTLIVYSKTPCPYYQVELPTSQHLINSVASVIFTNKTKRISGLTRQGHNVLTVLRSLKIGPQVTFDSTKLRIAVYKHTDVQLQSVVDALQPFVGELTIKIAP